MTTRRPTAVLVITLAFSGCFKVEYQGDVLFACDPAAPADTRCPEGYACASAPGATAPRCHRQCDPLRPSCPADRPRCAPAGVEGAHVCTTGVEPSDAGPGPDTHRLEDGPDPAPVCSGHVVLGALAPTSRVFDLVVDAEDRVVAVWIDPEHRAMLRRRVGSDWQPPAALGIPDLVEQLAATRTEFGLSVIFIPQWDHSVVQHCAVALDNRPDGATDECAPEMLHTDQSQVVQGLAIASQGDRTVVALALTSESSPVVTGTGIYYELAGAGATAPRVMCLDPMGGIQIHEPRIAMDDSAVVSTLWRSGLDRPPSWRLATVPNRGPGRLCQSQLQEFQALEMPTAANLVVDNGLLQTVQDVERNGAPALTLQSLQLEDGSGRAIDLPQRALPGSSDIARLEASVVISLLPEPEAVPQGPNPPRLWRLQDGSDVFAMLPAPEPVSPPGLLGATLGSRTRIVADPSTRQVHVLYDVTTVPAAERLLVYYRCDVSALL